jgi:predicted dienelactone hydrolase
MNQKTRFFVVVLLAMLALWMLPIPAPAQAPPAMPLAENGPYNIGQQVLTFVDNSRDGRRLTVQLWYPADVEKPSVLPARDAPPDTSGAPYPLIIFSHGLWDSSSSTLTLGPHLASQGFVVASIGHQDDPNEATYWTGLVYRPLDVLFVLNELAALSDGNLAGVFDANNVGVAGYSYGGLTALLVSGAQVDPGYLLDWCAKNEPDATPNVLFSGSGCNVYAARWDEVAAYRAQFGPLVEGELWPPSADERIRAAMPMAPCANILLGENGTAADRLPTLVVYGEKEDVCSPSDQGPFIYDHLGSPDRYLLTLLGAGHLTPFQDKYIQAIIRQFGTAFFGYYLQGKTEYAQYLTADYVGTLENVAWESSTE